MPEARPQGPLGSQSSFDSAPGADAADGSRPGRLLTVLAGLFLGALLYLTLQYWATGFRPEDAALGPFTVSRGAYYEGEPVVFRYGEQLNVAAREFAYQRESGREVVLWMGASHLYAINHYHPGEENAVYHANCLSAARGAVLRYLGLGLPNGNMNEFLGLYLYFRAQGLIPRWLVIGALFDDMREPGVRPTVRAAVPQLSSAEIAWMGPGARNLEELLTSIHPSDPITPSAVAGTPQERLEELLTQWLEGRNGPLRDRHRLRAFVEWKLRKGVFLLGEGLRRMGNPARKAPPVPEDLYSWNMEALQTLVRVARADGVNVLLYRVPHPQTSGPFYHDRKRYDAFFAKLQELAEGDEGVHVLDLETLVPLEQWRFGTYVDLWHFREKGHVLLADSIDRFLAAHEETQRHALQ